MREGDKARVVFVGAQERIVEQGVVRGPGVLQPLEHLVRLLAQSTDAGDLAAGAVGVFVDQFFQRRVGLEPLAVGKLSQRQCAGAPERIGFLLRQVHRSTGIAPQDLNDGQKAVVLGGLRLQLDGFAQCRLGLVVAAEPDETSCEVEVECGA